MKKIILFVLCFITLISFSGNTFASSKKPSKEKLQDMFDGAFSYLIKNRKDESREVSQRKQRAVALLTTGCIHDRDLLLQVYNKKEAECTDGLKMFTKNRDQNGIRIAHETLNEMHNIANIIGLKEVK